MNESHKWQKFQKAQRKWSENRALAQQRAVQYLAQCGFPMNGTMEECEEVFKAQNPGEIKGIFPQNFSELKYQVFEGFFREFHCDKIPSKSDFGIE